VSSANERLLLVTGCGRSGTKYISFVLRRLGRDVPDERVDGDVSGWTLAGPPARRAYGPGGVVRFAQDFDQVRQTLHAIASATTFGAKSWSYICAKHGLFSGGPSSCVLRATGWTWKE
jgi:hypothetical protein